MLFGRAFLFAQVVAGKATVHCVMSPPFPHGRTDAFALLRGVRIHVREIERALSHCRRVASRRPL